MMPITRLGPSCWNTPQLEILKQSLEQFGLQFPLLVWGPIPPDRVRINRGRWGWSTEKGVDLYMVAVGNQRLRAAGELGYTEISCCVKRQKHEVQMLKIHRRMRDFRSWRP
jgi:hypothetical protein